MLDNGPYPQITISLGVSSYPDDGKTIHDLIVASDQALLGLDSPVVLLFNDVSVTY
ncbi:MAG: hypothetical protein Q8911_12895 [Bacillota bacterium]|nr:hypothetical protein [Bacillota bacterium]